MSTNDMVRVVQPGHDRHNQCGSVVDLLPGGKYVVEFLDRKGVINSYAIESFAGGNLRALIAARV